MKSPFPDPSRVPNYLEIAIRMCVCVCVCINACMCINIFYSEKQFYMEELCRHDYNILNSQLAPVKFLCLDKWFMRLHVLVPV